MLTNIEQDYLNRSINKHVKRLTFDGINDLYNHPLRGSYTILQLIELEENAKNPPPKQVSRCEFVNVYSMEMSTELYRENERCIGKYGHSLFLL